MSTGEDFEKCTASANVKWDSHLGNNPAVSQQIKHGAAMWPRNSTSRYILRKHELGPGVVSHVCNPSHLGVGDQEDYSSRPIWTISSRDLTFQPLKTVMPATREA
jgi:hypothetical protein